MVIKKRSFIFLLVAFFLLLTTTILTVKYSLKYMNWYAKSLGYPEIYEQTEIYQFKPAPNILLRDSVWEILANDIEADGDIPNWADAKSLSSFLVNDTLWFRYSQYNNIDINEPMVSLALYVDSIPTSSDWYGTASNFKYNLMISAGYVRRGNTYSGYNFIGNETGVCTFHYDLNSNSLFLGLPIIYIEQYQGSEFVTSMGKKGLWNDDFNSVNLLELE